MPKNNKIKYKSKKCLYWKFILGLHACYVTVTVPQLHLDDERMFASVTSTA